MTKPFSTIQPPEEIAKAYNGDKQKIAEAMQMGIVDPTAGVLAGMFIDRMRSAQAQEGRNPPTVAQQVMGGLPPPPPVPPLPAGGVGSSSPAGLPPMAPPMGNAPMPEVGAPPTPPMAMADGGLAALPVPDAMFGEPDNGSYAGGGIVAFGGGGEIDRERLRAAFREQESSGDYGVLNRQGSGAMGAYQFMPATAKALAKRLGMEYRPDLMFGDKGRSKEGIAYQEKLMDAQLEDILAFSGGDIERAAAYHFAGPNKRLWGDATRKYQAQLARRYSGSKDTGGRTATEKPTSMNNVLSGSTPSILEMMSRTRGMVADNVTPDTKRRKAVAAELEAAIDPEARKAEREKRRWEALAQFGFQLAQSPGSLLQAASAAALNTLPMLREGDEQARKELRADLNALMALEDKSNEEKQQMELLAFELAKAEVMPVSEERKMELQYIISKLDREQQRQLAIMEIEAKKAISMQNNLTSVANAQTAAGARIATAGAGNNPFGLPNPAGGAVQPTVVNTDYGSM